MPDPTWQELYNAALVEFDLANLPEGVERDKVARAVERTERSTRSFRGDVQDRIIQTNVGKCQQQVARISAAQKARWASSPVNSRSKNSNMQAFLRVPYLSRW